MWTTIGHQSVVALLQRSVREERIAHAYLLVGPRQVGKMTLALDLARLVNCQGEAPCGECDQCRRIGQGLHADVQVVAVEAGDRGRERVNISIDQVREVQRDASLKPYEAQYRVFIVDGAERLSLDAANAMLKTLEEPPAQVILLLLATEADVLLPTIVSRCQRLDLRPLEYSLVADELRARFDSDDDHIEEIARLSGGRIGWAFEAMSRPELLERRSAALTAIEDLVHNGLDGRFSYAGELASRFGADRESAGQALELWSDWWRDVMMVKEGTPELAANLSRLDSFQAASEALSRTQVVGAIKSVQRAVEHLERNVNPRLALEGLMLSLPRF